MIWDGSRPSEAELQAIFARAGQMVDEREPDPARALQLHLALEAHQAQIAAEAAAQKHKLQAMHGAAIAVTAAVARTSVKVYGSSVTDRLAEGYKLIERIAFWSAIPVLGAFVINYLADRLDIVSDRLEGVIHQ